MQNIVNDLLAIGFSKMIIVAFLQNATIDYSSVSVCEYFRVCVFLHDNSKVVDLGTWNWNTL